MKAYHYKDPNRFLQDLPKLKIPKNNHSVYLYLPFRMMNIYQTVALFSWLDLTNGRTTFNPLLIRSSYFKEYGDKIVLGGGVVVDKRKNVVRLGGGQELKINSIFVTGYDKSGKLRVQSHGFAPNGVVSVIFMRSYGQFLVVDQNTLNSTYFKLFVFEQYDKNLFEPVVLTPLAKIYKIK
jgi:dolichyl-diphosphooligosaccharide--protein glycosyltransferase/undecaprenyl-diphosphooligosaccharide--protein glycosyltransferase